MSLVNKLNRLESQIVDPHSDCYCGKTFLHLHTDLDWSKLAPCRFCERQAAVWQNLFETAAIESRNGEIYFIPTQEKNENEN
jgi:hypothetical protein